MSPRPPRRTPTYYVNSVDRALRLLARLRDVGEIRVTDAADDLGISPSTVHRLMSMLVFRGFAVQDESHTYHAGPEMGVPAIRLGGTRELYAACKRHLGALSLEIGETAYATILTGTTVRFIVTAESTAPTHVGDRHGMVLPVESSAAGTAILSGWTDDMVAALCSPQVRPDITPGEYQTLLARIRMARTRGYALSIEEIESGIASVAMPVPDDPAHPPAAISVSVPPWRQSILTDGRTLARMRATRDAIVRDLASPAESMSD